MNRVKKFSSSSGVQKSAEVANDVFTSNEAKIVMIADHYMHKFFPCLRLFSAL
jgi:hypothetical protein